MVLPRQRFDVDTLPVELLHHLHHSLHEAIVGGSNVLGQYLGKHEPKHIDNPAMVAPIRPVILYGHTSNHQFDQLDPIFIIHIQHQHGVPPPRSCRRELVYCLIAKVPPFTDKMVHGSFVWRYLPALILISLDPYCPVVQLARVGRGEDDDMNGSH